MEKPLLFATSDIFNDSNLIDNIRQSFIDINEESDQESIQELVNEAINYLDKDISLDTANELYSLILKCFSCFSKPLLPIFNTLFEKSRLNANRFIATVTVLSYLINNQPNLELPDYTSFVNDAINEIRPQLQNKEISIFNLKIPCQFKYDLIVNFLLCSNMSKETISDFIPYIFSPDGLSNNLTQKSTFFIPHISDQIFIQYFKQFQALTLLTNDLNPLYALSLIQKCIKLNLKLSLKAVLLTFSILKPSDLTPTIIEYVNQYKFIIPQDKAKKFIECPFAHLFLDKFPSVSLFSDEKLIEILKKKTGIENADLTTSEFYKHLYSLFNKDEISPKLCQVIAALFKKFVQKEKFIQIIDEVIWSIYPPTNKGARFLALFLKYVDDEYSKMFYSKEHMNGLIQKVLDKKVTPLKSFVEIIDRNNVYEILQNSGNSPLLLYIYYFSSTIDSQDEQMNEITVLPQSNPYDEKLFEYIKNKDDDLLINLNDECLSLVSCSLIFASSNNKMVVNGLTKESILQFYSIASNSNIDLIDKISTPELLSLLIEGVKSVSNNANSIVNLSIDTILNTLKFNDDFKKQILQILAEFLFKKEYLADKEILLTKLVENLIQIDPVIEFIFDHCSEFTIKPKNKINDSSKISQLTVKHISDHVQNQTLTSQDLINIIQNLNNIFDFELKFNIENTQNLFKIFDEFIKEKKKDESMLICEFMVKNGIDIHEKISKLDEEIQFKYQLLSLIPNDLTEDEIISVFTSISNPEKNNSLIEALFNKMMNDEMNKMGYLISTFEKLFPNLFFKPNSLFQYYYDKYEKYQDSFIKALYHIFTYNSAKNLFLVNVEPKQFDFVNSEYNQKIISKLFDIIKENPYNYQSFFCLKCIACTFPFIFQSDPQKIIDLVLPYLNDFYLLFDEMKPEEQNEENIKKAKVSLAAYSFLFTTLNSIKMAEYVTKWYMTHYKELEKTQLYCFNLSLLILQNSHPASVRMLFLKYNCFEMFTYMLNFDVGKGLFSENFNYIVYLIIYNYFVETLSNIESLAAVKNVILNVESPFEFQLGKRLTILFDQSFFNSDTSMFHFTDKIKDQNKVLFEFISDFEELRPFWLSFIETNNKPIPITDEQINSFFNHYKTLITKSSNDFSHFAPPDFPVEPTKKMIIYLLDKPKWIKEFIMGKNNFPYLEEHYKMLSDIIEKLNQIQQTGKLSDDDTTPDILLRKVDVTPYFRDVMYNENFLNTVIEKFKKPNNLPIFFLYKIIQIMIGNPFYFDNFMSIVPNQITLYKDIEFNASVKSINEIIFLTKALLNVVFQMLSSNTLPLELFSIKFFDKYGIKFIDFYLHPNYRSFDGMLYAAFELMKQFPIKLPIPISHLIGFMLLSKNEKIISNGIYLCSKFDFNDLSHMEIIQNTFDNEVNSQNPRMTIISDFLKYYPAAGMARILEMKDALEKLIYQYESNQKLIESEKILDESDKNNQNDEPIDTIYESYDIGGTIMDNDNVNEIDKKQENENLSNFIIKLLDFLAPKRDITNSFHMSDSLTASQRQKNPNPDFYPIPDFINNTSPEFWELFENHRQLINTILLKKFQKNEIPDPFNPLSQSIRKAPLFSSRLVSEYPECFSFEFRSIFFRQKMIQQLQSVFMIKLKIDPNNIFASTMNQLKGLLTEFWFCVFSIKYINSIGQDAGGLTKDWLTKLSNEIFSPKSELFECLESNGNYMIKRSPNECTEETLYKYKFIGMIVARALIQGELINAYLSRPFLKQILHHEVNFNDIKDVDEQLYNSMKFLIDNDIDSMPEVEQYFEVCSADGKIIELKENGSEIKVTNSNKMDYIDLMTDYMLKKSINKQIDSFCEGFDSLIKHEDIRIFTPNELCLLICGVPDIDVEDWKRNVLCVSPYTLDTPVVKMFFNVISKWDKNNLSKLLMFITGSPRMNPKGFKYFAEIKIPIKISPGGDPNHLPTAHTCTNMIDLPEYENEEDLNQKLLLAINEESFDLK